MTERQRFALLIALAGLIAVALIGIVVSLLFAPAKVDQSPSLTVVLGLLVTASGAIIAVVQNSAINAKADNIAHAVNGGLETRIQAAVSKALVNHSVPALVADVESVMTPSPVVTDPHASAG